jgi:hypothetical protein
MGASESRQRDNDDDNPHPLPDFVHCGEISHLSSPILAAFDVLCLENRTNARAMRGFLPNGGIMHTCKELLCALFIPLVNFCLSFMSFSLPLLSCTVVSNVKVVAHG